MIEAALSNSTVRAAAPPSDDGIGMAWWNTLSKKERKHWLGVAKSARPVDAWRAFKAADRDGEIEREPDARKILTELFQEEMLDEPDLLADLVVARLGSRGFIIIHRDRP